MDFLAAYENHAVVKKIERIATEDIRKTLESFPPPTMIGLPVFLDPNMERNKAALVTKDGMVVTIVKLGGHPCHS